MDNIFSISQLKACMIDLGLSISDENSRSYGAKFQGTKSRAIGYVQVIFKTNPYSGDGPYIDLDDYAKGFKIPYSEFKPLHQDFEYNTEKKQLYVSGNDYKFTLDFSENF